MVDPSRELPEQLQKVADALRSISLRETIDVLSKVAVVLVGGCYVVGLLIVNLHLRQYGFSNLNFLQVDYVMAGAVWLFFIGLIVGLALYILSRLASIGEALQAGSYRLVVARILASLVFMIIASAIVLYALILLSDHVISILSVRMLTILAVLILNVGGVLLFGAAVGELVLGHALIPKKGFAKIGDYFRAFVYVGLFLAVLSLYSAYVFPSFSQTFGGGKTKSAEFIVKSESISTFAGMGIPVDPGTRRSIVVQVVFEGSDFFLIAVPSGLQKAERVKSIRLDKSLVEAILYSSDT